MPQLSVAEPQPEGQQPEQQQQHYYPVIIQEPQPPFHGNSPIFKQEHHD